MASDLGGAAAPKAGPILYITVAGGAVAASWAFIEILIGVDPFYGTFLERSWAISIIAMFFLLSDGRSRLWALVVGPAVFGGLILLGRVRDPTAIQETFVEAAGAVQKALPKGMEVSRLPTSPEGLVLAVALVAGVLVFGAALAARRWRVEHVTGPLLLATALVGAFFGFISTSSGRFSERNIALAELRLAGLSLNFEGYSNALYLMNEDAIRNFRRAEVDHPVFLGVLNSALGAEHAPQRPFFETWLARLETSERRARLEDRASDPLDPRGDRGALAERALDVLGLALKTDLIDEDFNALRTPLPFSPTSGDGLELGEHLLVSYAAAAAAPHLMLTLLEDFEGVSPHGQTISRKQRGDANPVGSGDDRGVPWIADAQAHLHASIDPWLTLAGARFKAGADPSAPFNEADVEAFCGYLAYVRRSKVAPPPTELSLRFALGAETMERAAELCDELRIWTKPDAVQRTPDLRLAHLDAYKDAIWSDIAIVQRSPDECSLSEYRLTDGYEWSGPAEAMTWNGDGSSTGNRAFRQSLAYAETRNGSEPGAEPLSLPTLSVLQLRGSSETSDSQYRLIAGPFMNLLESRWKRLPNETGNWLRAAGEGWNLAFNTENAELNTAAHRRFGDLYDPTDLMTIQAAIALTRTVELDREKAPFETARLRIAKADMDLCVEVAAKNGGRKSFFVTRGASLDEVIEVDTGPTAELEDGSAEAENSSDALRARVIDGAVELDITLSRFDGGPTPLKILEATEGAALPDSALVIHRQRPRIERDAPEELVCGQRDLAFADDGGPRIAPGLDASVPGVLAPSEQPGDEVYCRLTADVTAFARFTLTGLETDVDLELLEREIPEQPGQEPGRPEVIASSLASGIDDEKIEIDVSRGHEYFARIYNIGSLPSPFSFRVDNVRLSAAEDNVGPDSGPLPLQLEAAAPGERQARIEDIAAPAAPDEFEFTLDDRGVVSIRIDNMISDVDAAIYRRPALAALDDDDAIIARLENAGDTPEDATLFLEPGRYRIEVSALERPSPYAMTVAVRDGASVETVSLSRDGATQRDGFAEGVEAVRYWIEPEISGGYAFALTDLQQDLDLELTRGGGEVIGDSFASGASSESIFAELEAGELYGIAIIPYGGASSPFTLTITPP